MEKILVAIDFSKASQNALSYASYLANAFHGKLVVVHAFADTDAIDDIPIPEVEVYDSNYDLEQANLKYLKKEMKEMVKKFTVPIQTYIRSGRPENIVNKIAMDEKASLIVMGMKGRGESNSIFGSTTISMIGKTKLPILVVPQKAEYRPIENIAVATDVLEKVPVSSYALLNELAEKFDSFLHILNVQKRKSKLTAESVAGKMRTGLMWDKYNHNFTIIQDDDVEEGIHKYLKKQPVELLAMIAQKQNLLERIFGKSYTRSMTKQTEVPLLVLHEI